MERTFFMTNLHDAAFQEQAIAQWRDWRRFLSLHLQLIDVRSTAALDADAFEVADSAGEREREIKAQLAAIPADVRALFERVVDERRQQVHAAMDAERRASGDTRGHPLDADEVDRAALAALLDEAEGTGASGIGQVPLADGWYDVDAARLRDVPDEARYRLAGAKRLPAARLAAIVAVVVLGAAALWLTRPGRSGAASASAPAVVTVNGQAAELWAPRAMTLAGAQSVALPVVRRAAGADPRAAQWDERAWPLTICAPAETLNGLARVEVSGAGDAPARAYAIHDIAPEAADLVVAPCDGAGQRYYGALQSTLPLAAASVGEPRRLRGGDELTLRAIGVAGPGEDTRLPQGKAQVVVTADAPAAMDWSRVNASLRWPDGQDLLPSDSAPRDGGMTFRYLVPLFEAPLDVVQWRVTDPATGETLAWQARLEPPPARQQVLAGALADVRVQAERTPSGPLRVTLAVTNGGAGALALAEDDLVVVQGGRRLPVPPLEALRTPLAAGEQRAVELVLNTSPRESVTLSIGAFAFELAP
jgi:hypothetical protein